MILYIFKNKEELADCWASSAKSLRLKAGTMTNSQKAKNILLAEAFVLEQCSGVLRNCRFEEEMTHWNERNTNECIVDKSL